MSGVEEEVDRGYLEPGTNLVSVVSTLSPFSVSYHHSCNTGLIYHVCHRANQDHISEELTLHQIFILTTAAWMLHNLINKCCLHEEINYKSDSSTLIVLVHYLRALH